MSGDGAELPVEITAANPALADLRLSWRTAVFSADDGLGHMGSLHEAGDALAVVGIMGPDGLSNVGSAVMVGPGLLLTATHVVKEAARLEGQTVFLTFLPGATPAWLPSDMMALARPSDFIGREDVVSDLSLVSCTLNSEAHAAFPLTLAPMQIALPLVGERLWAMGFRQGGMEEGAALVTPLVSSGLVVAAYPNGRGERMISPCFEVDMDTPGGMSGGAVVNADGRLVGIVSSALDGGPSYATLIWDAVLLRVRGQISKLQRNPHVSLLGASAWGLAKLKGKVDRDPFGDVHMTLTREEQELFAASMPADALAHAPEPAMGTRELEDFVDTWGSELESEAVEGTLLALNRLSLARARDFLRDTGIDEDCLLAIEAFTVEDFDGLEDMTVTSSEVIDDGSFRLHYYFDIKALIWTISIHAAFAEANKDRLDAWSVDRRPTGELTAFDVLQHRYFRGSAVFHREAETLTDASITLSAFRPPRSARAERTPYTS